MDENTLRSFVRERLNLITNPKSAEELSATLRELLDFVADGHQNDTSTARSITEKQVFMENHYQRVLDKIIDNFTVEWFELIFKGKAKDIVNSFFLHGDPTDSLLALTSAIKMNPRGFKVQKCVSILEHFFDLDLITEVLKQQIKEYTQNSPVEQHIQESLLTAIVSLPDVVTAKLGRETSEMFFPEKYMQKLAHSVISVLEFSREHSLSVEYLHFLSRLFGRIGLIGHSETVWKILQVHFLKNCLDEKWVAMYRYIATNVSDRALESVMVPIVKLIPWYGLLDKLLGNSILTNRKLQYLFTNKLVLLRVFKEDVFLQNIIGYLACDSQRLDMYVQLLKRVLEVWGDKSAVKHTSYEQHKYITKAILVAVAFLKETEKQRIKDELMRFMMQGIQTHLDSSLPNVRRLGMIVAEAVTDRITGEQDPENKLKFEYEIDDEVPNLKSLLVPPPEPNMAELIKNMEEVSLDKGSTAKSVKPQIVMPAAIETKSLPIKVEYTDADSDDDLEPFDLSNDVKVRPARAPLYVRDCMEGLLDAEKADQFEICLESAAGLIRKHPSTVKEVAVEFTKILLHLEDKTALLGFELHRHAAMVALTLSCPVDVSQYLTGQFYERNYNIRQRLDMLEVLGAAAQELAKPDDGKSQQGASSSVIHGNTNGAGVHDSHEELQSKNWQEIVQERIEKKTRRFAKGRQTPAKQAVVNRFAPVAGHFFFPLMANYDKKEPSFDLLGDDHLLLSRLLYTLGIILHSATHAPVMRQMASALFEFLWAFQYHPEMSVRRAIIFCISMLFLSVDSAILLAEFQSELIEARDWLQCVMSEGIDEEGQKMAIQALMIMESIVKKEFESGDKNG